MFCTNCGMEFEGKFCPECGVGVVPIAAFPKNTSEKSFCKKPTILGGNAFFKVVSRPGEELTAAQQKMATAYVEKKIMQENSKSRIAENKINKVPMCPKCKSASIQPNNGKFHLGRAIIGGTFLGDGGVVMGLTHGKRTPMVCLNCGHKWKL